MKQKRNKEANETQSHPSQTTPDSKPVKASRDSVPNQDVPSCNRDAISIPNVDAILAMIGEGATEASACKRNGVSLFVWRQALASDSVLAARLSEAKRVAIAIHEEELSELLQQEPSLLPSGAIDSASVAHLKMKIEGKKWLLSKLAPEKYGEKLDIKADHLHQVRIQTIERIILPSPPVIK